MVKKIPAVIFLKYTRSSISLEKNGLRIAPPSLRTGNAPAVRRLCPSPIKPLSTQTTLKSKVQAFFWHHTRSWIGFDLRFITNNKNINILIFNRLVFHDCLQTEDDATTWCYDQTPAKLPLNRVENWRKSATKIHTGICHSPSSSPDQTDCPLFSEDGLSAVWAYQLTYMAW